MLVEPLPTQPAAVATLSDERALVVADVHVGIEAGLRYERGVELESAAEDRLRRLLSLLDETDADRLVVLGDLTHRIGRPDGAEVDELRELVDAVTERVPLTLVPGNHDGGIDEVLDGSEGAVSVVDGAGVRIGEVGFVHGHTWPAPAVLGSAVVCMGHEHPAVRLEDEVGGTRVERAWLRGPLRCEPFAERHADSAAAESNGAGAAGGTSGETEPEGFEWANPELVVFPAFNERSGGTWVNVPGQSFLSPFLPEGLEWADAYLLDGTRLGDYRRV